MKIYTKTWLIIFLLMSVILVMPRATYAQEQKPTNSRSFWMIAGVVSTVVLTIVEMIGLFKKAPEPQKESIPIWIWFAGGFLVLLLLKKMRKPKIVVYRSPQ